MANSKVVVDIIAPNSRTFNMLEFVLQQHGKGRFELSRGNRPDLVVVDFDKSDVVTAFRKFRSRFPEVPAVLLLNLPGEYEALPDEVRIGAEFLLFKPFAARDFISKINECLGGISEPSDQIIPPPESSRRIASRPERTVPMQNASSNQVARLATRQRAWGPLENEEIAYSFAFESDIDMSDEAAVAGIWLDTDNKLLGHLKRAISQQTTEQTALCLSVGDNLKVFVSPYARKVAVAGESADLPNLARQDFDKREITLNKNAIPGKDMLFQLETEPFLWKLALYTYRGYLPEGINVNKPVYLKYWPNLTRLEPAPNAMRIASLLCRQPVALAFVVRILNIPQRHVFNFYAAASASGFAGPAVREVDNMLLPSYPDESGDSPVRESFDKPLARGMTA